MVSFGPWTVQRSRPLGSQVLQSGVEGGLGQRLDVLADEEGQFVGVHAGGGYADWPCLVVVQMTELVRELLEYVGRRRCGVVHHVVVRRRHRALLHHLGDQEEVVPPPMGDHGVHERPGHGVEQVAVVGRVHREQARVDALLDDDVADDGLVRLPEDVEYLCDLGDLHVNHGSELAVADSVSVHDDALRKFSVGLLVRAEGVVHAVGELVDELLAGLLDADLGEVLGHVVVHGRHEAGHGVATKARWMADVDSHNHDLLYRRAEFHGPECSPELRVHLEEQLGHD
mmetsp:Transcript_25115/g.43345  ORF Transcript_25115/g.43345 Transcript_25115/m.43345 type:complete len:285 (-) Transcript_25115:446-1300(-)